MIKELRFTIKIKNYLISGIHEENRHIDEDP